MSSEMSLMSLLANASLTVKLVMLTLLLASVFSWAVILQRANLLRRVSAALQEFEQKFWSGGDLSKLYQKLARVPKRLFGMDAIFYAGFKEYSRLPKPAGQNQLFLDTIGRSMRIALANEEQRLEQHLSFLATVQSTSPYIGLFGTVWGIMHSFRHLGVSTQASLATVAPGIAEALVATAMGLIAAIPAGIAYNRYINRIDNISVRYRSFMEEFMGIVERRILGAVETQEHAANA